jgi:uncharacterized LabA/DUF88 family protein
MPGLPANDRMAVYIDGFNLYFGIRGTGWGRFLWLDLCAFSASLLKPNQQLVAVKYFTARVSGPESKRQRQNAYLDALGTLNPALFSIAYGNYQQNQSACRQCGVPSDVPNEKQTDVNIAVAMLTDAFKDRFDLALLISADSDLCPVVAAIRSLYPAKRIVVVFPPGRASKELKSIASACFSIGRARLSQSQFLEELTLQSGFKLRKPGLWNTEEYQQPH